MAEKYDEDLYENPFFIALQNEFADTINKTAANGWLVCIPQFSCVSKKTVSLEDVQDHVLVPQTETDGEESESQSFQSLSSKHCMIQDGQILTQQGYEVEQQVKILFEETFHTDSDESYRVLCVDTFLNNTSDATPSNETTVLKRPTSYQQCVDMLWNHTGGWKAKDHLDRMLNTFAMAFDQLEGQGLRSIMDAAGAQFTKVMQYVLKDSVLKRTAMHSTVYMENVKIAVETYYMHAVFRKLFRVVTACVGSEDGQINKLTRNLSSLTLQDMGIRKSFSKNVLGAKAELSRLNNFTTPIGRLFCVKRVVAALTRRPKGSGVNDPSEMMTTDDFLPILIYLIVKSEIPNWKANLTFMMHFHFAQCSEDAEFGFYLASIEAALEHIKSGRVKDEVLNKDVIKDSGWQGVNGLVDDTGIIQRQTSAPNLPVVEEFFMHVQLGDEKSVTEILERPKKEADELSQKLCHPLCNCDKCEKIHMQIRSNCSLVTAYTRDIRGYTALHIGASCGQAQLIDLLVKHGAVVDATDYLGLTPLHLACQNGFQNVMLLLLHFGANISACDGDGNTPLHLCAANGHEDCVKALIFFDSKKININAKNDIGNTPLHLASKWGYEAIVKVFLESGADPNLKNRKKQTPLSLTQNVSVQRMLTLAGKGINIQPSSSSNNLRESISRPPSATRVQRVSSVASSTSSVSADSTFKFEIAVLDDSVNEKLKKKIDKLFRAIIDGDTQLVKFYLGFNEVQESFDEDSVDGSPSDGPCHPLCQCPRCQNNFQETSSSSNDLSVNCRSANGYTPLHIAVMHGQTDLVQEFVQRGAAVNVQNHKLMTSIHVAACMKSEQMLKTLLDGGGKVAVQDVNGDTPLHMSCATGFTRGVCMFLQHRASIAVQNCRGNTPLHEATSHNHKDIVEILLRHGASPRIKNKQELLPQDLAEDTDLKELLQKNNKRESGKSDFRGKKVGIRALFAAFEESDLSTLKQITSSIQTFDRRKSLRKTLTRDLSAPKLDTTLVRNLSIRSFDHGRLRHIDSLDKSEPLYIYRLAMQGQNEAIDVAYEDNMDEVFDSDSDDDIFRAARRSRSMPILKSKVSDMENLTDVPL